MKTYSPKPGHIERRWYVIDASDVVLGRLASEAAALLRGKHKPIFAPHMDTGDHVIIVNASKVAMTGGKERKKVAYRHSGYPGGISATGYAKLLEEKPAYAVEKAVKGMLPKNRLGRAMVKKLHVVPGPEHPHTPQRPEVYTLGRPPLWGGLPATQPSLKTRHLTKEEAARGKAQPASAPTEALPGAEEAAEATMETAVKRPAARKPAAKKPTARKSTATKTTAKKTTAKKTAAKKPTAKKPTTTKKTAARKGSAERPADDAGKE
jgi:large subunit ribosomal protein L13